MRKTAYILFLIINYALIVTAQQTVKWSKEIKSNQAPVGGSIFSDLKGNAYGYGVYINSANVGPGYSLNSGGANNPMFIYGLDTSNGTTQWVSEIKPTPGCGCNYGARSNIMQTNNSGNLLVAGYFCNCGTMAFGTQTLSALSHQTFLAKYDKTGNLLWVRTKSDVNSGTGVPDNYIQAVTTDEFDNVYLSIYSNLSATFAGLTVDKGIYIVKLTANGVGIWAKRIYDFNTPNDGLSIKQLQYLQNRLYASSIYAGSFTFSGQMFSSTNMLAEAAILKMDTAANIINASFIKSSEEDYEFNLKLLPNASLIYCGVSSRTVSGTSSASLSIGSTTLVTNNAYTKYYFVKLDTSLNVIATKNLNVNLYPYVVSNDLNNNIYFTVGNGLANNTVDGVTLPNVASYILKMDDNLNIIQGYEAASLYVCADKDANLYTTTSTTSVTVNAFNTNFTPSGPQTYTQFQIKLGQLATGLRTANATNGAQLYPNPSGNGIYNLKINDGIKQKQNIQITLTNALGQSFGNIAYTMENNQTIQVNLANLATGLYNITAIIDGKSYSAKLEKE